MSSPHPAIDGSPWDLVDVPGSPFAGLHPELSLISQLVGIAHVAAKARFDEFLEGSSISSITHWAALSRVKHQPGITGISLSRLMNLTPQAVQLILKQLVARGLVTRTPDGTAMKTYLTTAGRAALVMSEPAVEQFNDMTAGRLRPDQVAALERLLIRYLADLAAPAGG